MLWNNWSQWIWKINFLKVLSGKLNPNSGIVSIEPGKRMSVLEQNHSAYDDFQVLQSTLMGNKELMISKMKWINYIPKKILMIMMVLG